MPDKRSLQTGTPEVIAAREFLEIARDFTDPKEAIREAISNSLDWGATEIKISVHEDKTRPDNELILEIRDNGEGLNQERLKAFFDLGNSTALERGEYGEKLGTKIGEKGHGTKVFFNSRRVEVESRSAECYAYAEMNEPLAALLKDQIPSYGYEIEEESDGETYTKITIYGYDNNNKKDFAHAVLKDYILWFTKFGSVEYEFESSDSHAEKVLLKGLGADKHEEIEFGHVFAQEANDISQLKVGHPGDWPKYFVKRWRFEHIPVIDNPGLFIDFVLYLEGDSAKRRYNLMIRGRGRTAGAGMYKVEDRYGLYACKDYIPVQRRNDWISLGQAEWTKYHAFVNCQDFRLTANRGDIANTDRELLDAIGATVRQLYEEKVLQSSSFQEYEEAAEQEERYRDAQQEGKDFQRRQKLALAKKIAKLDERELLEPRQEAGVVALFTKVSSLQPTAFPFRIVDYDTKRGYDALAATSTVRDLSKDMLFFVEFKHQLRSEFDHSFSHLVAVVCWDCALGDGAEISDIANKRRTLRITPPGDSQTYTKYMLVSPTEQHNVEVFVLKEYLAETLGIQFKARAARSD